MYKFLVTHGHGHDMNIKLVVIQIPSTISATLSSFMCHCGMIIQWTQSSKSLFTIITGKFVIRIYIRVFLNMETINMYFQVFRRWKVFPTQRTQIRIFRSCNNSLHHIWCLVLKLFWYATLLGADRARESWPFTDVWPLVRMCWNKGGRLHLSLTQQSTQINRWHSWTR